jgi:hypothetical protein
MEAICFSETPVDFQRTTWHYIPEDSILHNRRGENLKSYVQFLLGTVRFGVGGGDKGYSGPSQLKASLYFSAATGYSKTSSEAEMPDYCSTRSVKYQGNKNGTFSKRLKLLPVWGTISSIARMVREFGTPPYLPNHNKPYRTLLHECSSRVRLYHLYVALCTLSEVY